MPYTCYHMRLIRQNIRSSCKTRPHPQSDERDLHPSPWPLSQLFWKWTLWKYGNHCKPMDSLIMRSWVAGALLMRPKCNSQFLTMPTWMKCLLFFLYIMQHKFIISNIPCLMHQPSQSLQFCRNFSNLRVVLILHHKYMHLIKFDAGVTWLFLHTSFLSLPFNILTEIPVASSSMHIW